MKSSSLLLTIDVGNTATSAALFESDRKTAVGRPLRLFTIGTNDIRSQGIYRRFLSKRLGSMRGRIKAAIVSSVVPPVDRVLESELRDSLRVPVHFVSADTRSRIKVRYRVPSEVGADRLVNARGSLLFGAGPKIIIDFGTATTFDCVNRRNEYLGGVIAPGPIISAEALYQRTAKLPLVVLQRPARIMGRNTLESIQAGLYHGYRGLVREIVDQLRRHLGGRCLVLATGGQAKWILKGLSVVDHHAPYLTHQGLYLLWQDLKNEH